MKMTKPKFEGKVIVYRDLKHDNYDNEYELTNPTGDKVIKEQIIPGKLGYPDMYIRHLSVTWKNQHIPIFSYTDYELNIAKRVEILAQSVKLLDDNE